MIEWIPHDDGGRVRPRTVGYAVRAMKMPTSQLMVETDKYISIDFVPVGIPVSVTLYHFVRESGKWLLRTWDELDDEHRLLLRVHPAKRLYEVGEYKDERYYTLEALV